MEEKDALLLNPLQLAYMGDTVWEMMVRSRLIRQRKNVRNMHKECVESVNAGAQARFLAAIRDTLTETEFDVYHRGRNAHPHHASPRNQNPADYAEATGFEAVLGFLYLTGQEERMRELERIIWDKPETRKETDPSDRDKVLRFRAENRKGTASTMAERKEMKVELIRHTLCPEETIALGAKLCYSRAQISDLKDRIESKDQNRFIGMLLGMGHESVFEHASFTFGIEGVSRVLLAQLTRHRVASFSVQSQRYVSYENGFGYILPPQIEALGPEAAGEYQRQMDQMQKWYIEWQERLGKRGEGSNEDARFVLPNACETRILMTMNVRELRHFFSLRMCSRAQWEIREMATRMHRLCLKTAPALFADAGPACLRGKCSEGEKSCGKMSEIRKKREKLLQSIGFMERKE